MEISYIPFEWNGFRECFRLLRHKRKSSISAQELKFLLADPKGNPDLLPSTPL